VLTAAVQAQGRVAVASVAEGVSTVVMVVAGYAAMEMYGLDGVAWTMVAVAAGCCVWLALLLTWRTSSADRIHHPDPDEIEPTITDSVEHRLT